MKDKLLSELELRRLQIKFAKRAISLGDYDGYFTEQLARIKARAAEIVHELFEHARGLK